MIGYDVFKVSASQVSTLEIAKGFCAKVFTTNFLPNSHQIFSEKRRMSSLGTSKGVLEMAKFGVYVTIPIVLMYTFANNTKNLQKFMGNRSYIVYPPEGPRPPSPEELREMARELARKRNDR